jgi:hypothetical protein
MKVLVACEESGKVRDAFARRGHDAWSCDILPSRLHGQHIQDDVFKHLDEKWDMMIFFWPCTNMLLSGVRWLTTVPNKPKAGILYGAERMAALKSDAESFRRLLHAPIPKICGENPTMTGQAQKIIGTPWKQKIQPWQFGHGETKATFLWLKNLPPLVPTNIVPGREARIHKMSPGANRSRDRSETYQGIADAMASQWG